MQPPLFVATCWRGPHRWCPPPSVSEPPSELPAGHNCLHHVREKIATGVPAWSTYKREEKENGIHRKWCWKVLSKTDTVVMFRMQNSCKVFHTMFFSGPLGGEISPLSFEFPLPRTITNFICFLDILHIFSPHKSNFPPKTTSLEKTLVSQLIQSPGFPFQILPHSFVL